MLNGDHGPLQFLPGVGPLLDSQRTVGIIKKRHLGYFIVDHGDVLSRLLADDIMRRGIPFNHGIIADFAEGDLNAAVPIRHKDADGVAVRADDLETAPADGNFRPRLIFEDSQPGFIFNGGAVRVVAVSGKAHGRGGVGVHHIILDIPVLILLGADRIVDGVLIDIGAERELDTAGFAIHAFQRVQNLELAGIAVAGALRGNGGDVPVVHVHNPGAVGNRSRICKEHLHRIVTYPGFAPECENLLFVLLSINGDLVGRVPIRGAGDFRGQHLCPGRAAGIDVLGGGEHLLGALQFYPGKGRVDLEVVDVPVAQKVTPERHLRGVVALVLVLQAKLLQGTGGVTVGDDAQHFGI